MVTVVVIFVEPLTVPVTVYVVVLLTALGVPEIAPVVVNRINPAGSAGDILKEVIVPPPVFTIVSTVIGVPTVNVRDGVVYWKLGVFRLTAMVRVAVEMPLVFAPVIV